MAETNPITSVHRILILKTINDMEKQIAEQQKVIDRLKEKFDYKEKQPEIKTISRYKTSRRVKIYTF